jgi:hypothetical protein
MAKWAEKQLCNALKPANYVAAFQVIAAEFQSKTLRLRLNTVFDVDPLIFVPIGDRAMPARSQAQSSRFVRATLSQEDGGIRCSLVPLSPA